MRRLLNWEDHKVGMRVKLTHPLVFYPPFDINPVVGSKWECAGTICKTNKKPISPKVLEKSHVCQVVWDNHKTADYHVGTLSACNAGEAVELVSLWND